MNKLDSVIVAKESKGVHVRRHTHTTHMYIHIYILYHCFFVMV